MRAAAAEAAGGFSLDAAVETYRAALAASAAAVALERPAAPSPSVAGAAAARPGPPAQR